MARDIVPGLALAGLVAACAQFLATAHGGQPMLIALLIGLAFHFLADHPQVSSGLAFANKTVLRVGVALLGVQLTMSDLVDLGPGPAIVVGACVVSTLAAGVVLARLLGRTTAFGILIGGATAICGASAAMAISTVLGRRVEPRDVAFAVISAAMLSTIAMVSYPLVASMIGFDDRQTGVLIGATIHDVAQVVGAGFAVSDEAGQVATVVKLLRIALLVPILLALGLWLGASGSRVDGKTPVPVPLFAVAFLVLVVINSLTPMPDIVRDNVADLSRWCLVVAVASLGLTTSISAMRRLDARSLVLPLGTSTLILVVALGLIIGFVEV